MAYEFKQNFVPSIKYSVKCPYAMTPMYITVHNTANDASAESEIAYMLRNNLSVSYHAAIDDKYVIQAIPYDRNAWHCGDGSKGVGNRSSIGLEICYSKSGGERYMQAEENAVQYIAKLLHDFGWGVDRVKQHFNWSGKNCPHRIREENRWSSFIARIQTALDALKGKTQTGVIESDVNLVNAPAKTESSKSVAVKPTKPKYETLEVDGYWGKKTTKRLQEVLGTTADGIISGQVRNDIVSRIENVQYGKGGSNVVRAMQKKLGVEADGYFGPKTLTALQKRLGTIQDGKLSRPSLVVKALQKRLNQNTF